MIYDLVVLGGGPAGYRAAERYGEAGKRVALIEERRVGGTCLNEGCIPTKALLYSAKLLDGAAHGDKYGVFADGCRLDPEKAVKRKDKVVKTLVLGVQSALKSASVTLIPARGIIEGRNEDGFLIKAGEETIAGKRLLIASGSVTAVPPIPGLKEGMERGTVVTSREILSLTEIPKTLTVIGGGVIGLELASYFHSAGTKVTVVEMLDHIAGNTDVELAALLQKNYEKKGVSFLLSAKVTEVTGDGIRFIKDDREQTLTSELVLLSIGRRPNAAGIGLETLGIATERGAILTDERLRTNVEGVYAAGDVNGKSLLAHTAYREAEVAVNDMLGMEDHMQYDAIPSVLYTNPELASVGETVASALEKGRKCKLTQLPMRFSGRYLAENEGGDGILKLVTEEETGRILGLQALGNYASEFIVAAAMAITMNMTANDLTKVVFPHPTVGEVLREAAFSALKND